ncbi:uncharacterized protein LOC143608414 [Bidens hawaiensis]|uniref:uncharacterized protein LOC143608414 n=1 Tax=Bidens hawaiensis TaxID=980011 RepID=UPI004049757E
MNKEEVKKVSAEDLQLVQHLIERCIQLYMNQNEVVATLQQQAKIEPTFTKLVWQKLEEENQVFFKQYHIRLILKDQILRFNELLDKQATLMKQMSPATGAASVPITDGTHIPSSHQNSSCYAPDNSQAMNIDNMQQPAVVKMPGELTNGGPTLHPSMQSSVGMSGLSRCDNMSQNPQSNQHANVGIMNGMSDEHSFMYNSANNVVARHPVMPEVARVPSFIGEYLNAKPVNDPIVEPDSSSFGFLSQIPRNFSFSDLTADFSISSDILDSYSGSLYLPADTESLNSHGNGDIQGSLW